MIHRSAYFSSLKRSAQDSRGSLEGQSTDSVCTMDGKRKRKPNFSEEESRILIEEVTKNKRNLFVTSKLPYGKKKALWQRIVDKINAVASSKRTIVEVKKRWHDHKRRTTEAMEELTPMEEHVARVLSTELVARVKGFDTADLEMSQTHMGTPLQEDDDFGGGVSTAITEQMSNFDDHTFNSKMLSLTDSQTTMARNNDVVNNQNSTVHSPLQTTMAPSPQIDVDDPEVSFERKVVDVQVKLVEVVKNGMDMLSDSIKGIQNTLHHNENLTETVKDTHIWLHSMNASLADIASVMKDKANKETAKSSGINDGVAQLAQINESIQAFHKGVESKFKSHALAMTALNKSLLNVIEHQQTLERDINATFHALNIVLAKF